MTKIGSFYVRGVVTAVAACWASLALAQQAVPEKIAPEKIAPALGTPAPRGMPMAMPGAGANPSTKAFKAADDQMMRAMRRPLSGDADQDFVSGMLPHHQGAVAMAKVELRYGKDPELLRLAHGIVAAQEEEIARMQAWQKKHPAQP